MDFPLPSLRIPGSSSLSQVIEENTEGVNPKASFQHRTLYQSERDVPSVRTKPTSPVRSPVRSPRRTIELPSATPFDLGEDSPSFEGEEEEQTAPQRRRRDTTSTSQKAPKGTGSSRRGQSRPSLLPMATPFEEEEEEEEELSPSPSGGSRLGGSRTSIAPFISVAPVSVTATELRGHIPDLEKGRTAVRSREKYQAGSKTSGSVQRATTGLIPLAIPKFTTSVRPTAIQTIPREPVPVKKEKIEWQQKSDSRAVIDMIDPNKLIETRTKKGESYNLDELRSYARLLGLNTSGRKGDIITRIKGKLRDAGRPV